MLESLDNPIWFALTTEHRSLACSHGFARRYPPDVSPLAALLHPTNDAFADLQRLVSPGEQVALFTASPFDVPAGWQVDRSRWIDQMICEASLDHGTSSKRSGLPFIALGVGTFARALKSILAPVLKRFLLCPILDF
jgi:hypothetical protein